MRVLLVHATPLDYLGGAELSLRHHVVHAPPDVEVTVVLPDDERPLDAFEAVILGNLRPDGDSAEHLAPAERWTRRLNVYRGYSLRSERDVHPCGLRDGSCVDGDPFRHLGSDCIGRTREVFARLYSACSAVHYLSPAHEAVIEQLVPVPVRRYVIGSPIDLNQFANRRPWRERKQTALILGDEAGVAPTAELRARQQGFEPVRLPPRSVPYEEMPDLLNRHQAVVVDPVMFHAFGRIVVEALSCGCRVIASRRVGARPWEDPLQAAAEANARFWEMIRKGVSENADPRSVARNA